MHVGFEEASGPSTFRRLHHRNHVLQFCEQLHPPRQTGIVLKPIVWVWLKDEPVPNISGVLLILLQKPAPKQANRNTPVPGRVDSGCHTRALALQNLLGKLAAPPKPVLQIQNAFWRQLGAPVFQGNMPMLFNQGLT